jgi:hypothetical protein
LTSTGIRRRALTRPDSSSCTPTASASDRCAPGRIRCSSRFTAVRAWTAHNRVSAGPESAPSGPRHSAHPVTRAGIAACHAGHANRAIPGAPAVPAAECRSGASSQDAVRCVSLRGSEAEWRRQPMSSVGSASVGRPQRSFGGSFPDAEEGDFPNDSFGALRTRSRASGIRGPPGQSNTFPRTKRSTRR